MAKKVHAVDLDGTLAHYDPANFQPGVIGAPVPIMLDRVKRWLNDGDEVVIFTARLSGGGDHDKERAAISAWTQEHVGQELEATAVKEKRFTDFWDDEAHGVVKNEGTEKSEEPSPMKSYCYACGGL